MLPDDDILAAMDQYGGSFVKQLAILYRHADLENKRILKSAFYKYFVRYDEIASRIDGPRRPV